MRVRVFDINQKAAICVLACFCAFGTSCIPSPQSETRLGISVVEVSVDLEKKLKETYTSKPVEDMTATALNCMGPSKFTAKPEKGRSALQFMFAASTNGYLYLVEEGTSGRVKILPWDNEGERLYFDATSSLPIFFPGGGIMLDYGPDDIGENRYIVLLSKEPIDGFTSGANDEDIRLTVRELEYKEGDEPDTTRSAADIYASPNRVLVARFTINVQDLSPN